MQFQVGDRVVHPVYGVGTIRTLTVQQFAVGKKRQYFEVITDGPTVWVPIDDEGLTVMRGIASEQSLEECRQLLTSAPVPLEKNRQLRQFQIAERLKAGMLTALCEMLRDLRASSTHTPLGIAEDRLLKRIFKSVCEEWAAAAGISVVNAMREVEELLQQSYGSPMSNKRV